MKKLGDLFFLWPFAVEDYLLKKKGWTPKQARPIGTIIVCLWLMLVIGGGALILSSLLIYLLPRGIG